MACRTRMGPIGGFTRWALRCPQRGMGIVLVVTLVSMAACAYRVLS